MSGKGITETGCAREKSRVGMSGTIGEKFDSMGVLLGTQPGCTSGDRRWGDEGRNSGASTVKVAIE